MFFVSQAVSSGLCPGTCVVPSSALVVGGTDTSSRHWSPASPFPVPHSREPGPGSPESADGEYFYSFTYLLSCSINCWYCLLLSYLWCLVCSILGEFPTEPVTREAHPYPPQVRARRTFLVRRPVPGHIVAVQGQHLQQSSSSSVALLWFGIPCEASARSREADSDQVRYQFNGIGRGVPSQLVSEKEISEMADRRDWGGGGDDPEESTQRIIERIWESLTDIRARMDQQAPVPQVAVPLGDGEAVPVAPVPPRVEVPFVAPVPPPPPVLIAEEPMMQVEKFLRLQPPTYLGGPNPDTAEHWVHEIERVFATMRCPAADRVVLAAYQLRGFALEWWRLKMQTTFAGRTEEAITWPEFLDVFNDTFFPIQVQQVKREQFRTLQQGNSSVLEYQMRFMALSRYAPYVVSDNNMMVEYFIRGLRVELQDAIVPLMCKSMEEAAQRAATLERSIRTRQAGEGEEDVSRPTSSSGPRRSGVGSAPPAE
ncbi:hypothetical protein Taro_011294 [Colocasia esculenta]|uniref:Retrotransposon gag domain-containing protein n=1 Tax=Colocasia esculenta TaxID=4460 RepID=A0A843U9V6_COLES|nr:hypothetical protein [Colocasia esculenta]